MLTNDRVEFVYNGKVRQGTVVMVKSLPDGMKSYAKVHTYPLRGECGPLDGQVKTFTLCKIENLRVL